MRLPPRYTLVILVVCAAIPNLSHAAISKFKIPHEKPTVKTVNLIK